jgi:hypothetical protein
VVTRRVLRRIAQGTWKIYLNEERFSYAKSWTNYMTDVLPFGYHRVDSLAYSPQSVPKRIV